MLSHLPRRVAAAIKLSAIKSLVLTLRRKLEDDIAIQLKLYGFAGERWLPHIQGYDQVTIDHYRLKTALEQQLRRMGRATIHGSTVARWRRR